MTDLNLSKIKWEKIDMNNREHVNIIMYLKHQSKQMRREKYLLAVSKAYGLEKEYYKYLEEKNKIEENKDPYYKKEVKHKSWLLREEMIIKCCIEIKKDIDSWDLVIDTDRESYYHCERKDVLKKIKKL